MIRERERAIDKKTKSEKRERDSYHELGRGRKKRNVACYSGEKKTKKRPDKTKKRNGIVNNDEIVIM